MSVVLRKTTITLVKKAQAHNKKALKILTNRYETAVHNIARKYWNYDVCEERLIQCGREGVLKAINLYRTDVPTHSLSEFVHWFIRQAMKEELGMDKTVSSTISSSEGDRQ